MREITHLNTDQEFLAKKFRSKQMRSDADPHSFPRCIKHLLAPPSKAFQRERWPSGHAMISPERKKGSERKYQFLVQNGRPLEEREHERVKAHYHAVMPRKTLVVGRLLGGAQLQHRGHCEDRKASLAG